MKKYIPEKGDVVWVNFNPLVGHEQASKRPALVISPREYNKKTNLALMCPITTRVKGYPFEVALKGGEIEGVVIADQVKSLDWVARRVRFVERVSVRVLDEVVTKIIVLLK